MERLGEAKSSLEEAYNNYNEAVSKKLPELNTDCKDGLTKLLEIMHKTESLAERSDNNYPSKLSMELRGKIADVLLLFDGFDFKAKKELV